MARGCNIQVEVPRFLKLFKLSNLLTLMSLLILVQYAVHTTEQSADPESTQSVNALDYDTLQCM